MELTLSLRHALVAGMNLAERTDNELFQRLRSHDEQALHTLLRRYYARLGAFAFAMVRQRDLAEEAVSNVFLSLWRRRETLVINTTVRGYLFAATSKQASSLLAANRPGDLVALGEVKPELLADHQGADAGILRSELQQAVDAVLARMPEQRRVVFCMCRLEGMRYKEIAAVLEISERTVQNHMVKAMHFLAEELPKLRGNGGALSS